MPEMEVADEWTVFCPHCRGRDVCWERELRDDSQVFGSLWKCQDCGTEFSLEQRWHLVWQEAGGQRKRRGGEKP